MFHPFVGDVANRRSSNHTHEKTRVDLVDFDSPDRDLKHVHNLEPLIA